MNNDNWGVTIDSMTPGQAVWSIVYFTFTTVLTVGLGDFAFYSNYERMLGSFLMLGGVAYFMIIRDNFMNIYQNYNQIYAPIDQREELDLFFNLLKKMNNGVHNMGLKNQLESYFEYRWENNMNWGLTLDEDLKILDQLPSETQQSLISDFLFCRFYKQFKRFYTFPIENGHKHSFYTFETSPEYVEFMISIFRHLYPLQM